MRLGTELVSNGNINKRHSDELTSAAPKALENFSKVKTHGKDSVNAMYGFGFFHPMVKQNPLKSWWV